MNVGMSESSSVCCNHAKPPHTVFFPSGLGVGKSSLFFRLAAALSSHGCTVTFITMQPPPPQTSTTFFSNHPEIKKLDFEILPPRASSECIINNDPFMMQIDAISRSLVHLGDLIHTLDEPVSALVSDFVIADGLTRILADLGIDLYILSTTSAWFYSTVAYLPVLLSENPAPFGTDIAIPGLAPVPISSIPNSWQDNSPTNYVLTEYLLPNAKSLCKVKGVLLNTFNWFEPETITALDTGRVLNSLPPVFPVGPLVSTEHGTCPWLDDDAAGSVVYVNFGSTEPMSKDQILEIRKGLNRSGCGFLWILREEHIRLLGESESDDDKGRITTEERANQEAILGHPAVGLFVNQCEWDSVMQAARSGVPVLAWPQHGDQKINAEVVQKAGLGVWAKEWGWGEERLVSGEEIAEKVRMMIGDSNLSVEAKKVREEVQKAIKLCGSENKLLEFINHLKGG